MADIITKTGDDEIVEIAKSSTDSYIKLHSNEFRALNVDEFAIAYAQIYLSTKEAVRSVIKQEEKNNTLSF